MAAVATADLNGDGKADVAAIANGQISVLDGSGDGGYSADRAGAARGGAENVVPREIRMVARRRLGQIRPPRPGGRGGMEGAVLIATILRTDRLLLRRFRPDDASAIHAALSDPEAMRFWSTLPHAALAHTRAWVDGTIAAVAAGESDDFAVEHAGALIGKAGLWQGDEIGFIFARPAWGQGFAREAVAAVCDHAFAAGREVITADVDPRNTRALRLLTSLGFTETGRAEKTFQLGQEWADSVYLARHRPPKG
jgi:RimJ/RimL family protein N-acetyltransferase